ncbi:MAG: amylo-alpha-1,6-glucosidase [Candidatus Bathyarchaeia archaeon]
MTVNLPRIRIGSETLSDLDKAIQNEWIVTNGLGGYASSTILGINTRKYHGLLVAAFNPPTDRRVLLTKLDEEIQIENKTYHIQSNEFRNKVHPEGYRFLSSFALEPFPAYGYSVHGFQLQKIVFMPRAKNATIILYRVFNLGNSEASIQISPLVNSRHFHSVTDKDKLDWNFIQNPSEQEVTVQPSIPLSTLTLFSSEGHYAPNKGEWVEEMYFRVDSSRGESCLDDNFKPGHFNLQVAAQETKRFFVLAAAGKDEAEAEAILSSIPRRLEDIEALFNQELNRRKGLLRRFQERHTDVEIKDWLRWLLLATDSFIVNRESTRKKSVIAGYHWFEDWGRDSLISLPGLTLVTGRFEDAKEILLSSKHYCNKGIIPNRFPDCAGDEPDYNTVDATLWYINAAFQFLKYTGDFNFIQENLWQTLKAIIEHHVHGTFYNIHMEDDGLITHGPQLTWMDATTDDSFVTPRQGKAVEVQALWYNALRIMQILATRFNQKEEAKRYSAMAETARKSFREKFWNPQEDCLLDVIDEEKKDRSIRPNQIIAVALEFSILDKAKNKSVAEAVWKRLWSTYGLRTISKDDPRYVGKYVGDWNQRNRAYHNGTVWPWLIGPFTTAFLKVKNHEKHWRNFAFKTFLQPLFQRELYQAGLGTISEIFEGDPPHSSRGCIAQAWSMAEPLRTFVEDVLLKRPPYERQILVGFGQ